MSDVTFALQNGIVLDNRYVIQGVVGSGGFGITYKALDRTTQDFCAIKELFPRQLAVRMADGITVCPMNNTDPTAYNHCRERFGEEALSLQALKDVSGVVNVTDYFEQNGTCYFAMEYLDGLNLRQLARNNGGRLDWQNLSFIIKKAGEALADTHRNRIFHRDISPDNIIFTRSMDVKLIDFGNAKELARTNNDGLSVFLKPGFAPLEQYSSKRSQGAYTDVYSLAATTYYLLTGKKVPDAVDRLSGNGYPTLSQLGFPNYLSDGIDRALAIDYKKRTQSVDELLYNIGLSDSPGGVIPEAVLQEDRYPTTMGEAILEVHVGSSLESYILPPNNCLLIGRSPDRCNVVVNVGYVGREHLEIMYDNMADELYVRDCNTRNGTFIKQTFAQMTPDQIMMVPFGTIMYLGGGGCWIRVIKVNNQ